VLTEFVNIPDVRRRFREEFPRTPSPTNNRPLAPPLTKNYAVVGSAFDYLLRFYIKRLNPRAESRRWVVERVPHKNASAIVEDAKVSYEKYLTSGVIDDQLLESVVRLASLEPFYRSSGLRGSEYVGQCDRGEVEDLRALISLVDPKLFTAKHTVLLNPTFGEGSILVEGADADLIIDDTIFDIKTVMHLQVRRDTYNQLIGYYTLSTIGGISGVERNYQINKLAVYFSRFAEVRTFDIADIIDANKFPSFVEWFRDRAKQEYDLDTGQGLSRTHRLFRMKRERERPTGFLVLPARGSGCSF